MTPSEHSIYIAISRAPEDAGAFSQHLLAHADAFTPILQACSGITLTPTDPNTIISEPHVQQLRAQALAVLGMPHPNDDTNTTTTNPIAGVMFTSATPLRFLPDPLLEALRVLSATEHFPILAIGPKTTTALTECGIFPSWESPTASVIALTQALGAAIAKGTLPGGNYLWPCGRVDEGASGSGDKLQDFLARRQANQATSTTATFTISPLLVYHTRPAPEHIETYWQHHPMPSIIALTSPSNAQAYLQALAHRWEAKPPPHHINLVAIGHTTHAFLSEALTTAFQTLRPWIRLHTATQQSLESLAERCLSLAQAQTALV